MPAAPAERDEIDRVTARLVAALRADGFAAAYRAGHDHGPGEAPAMVQSFVATR